MTRAVLCLMLPLALAGCGENTARHRITNALTARGMAPAPAACMADHLVDRLTMAQLRKLEALKGTGRDLPSMLMALGRIDDPQVREELVVAAGTCLLVGR
ncbi:hypothetical protein GTZ99_04005 [Novosphingobium sp. FSY-8]|uniref:Lipoprotein n=1 Tax=Novosphingobium ovatum TaxID=1908523 RepID=A0ABW9XB40_9SPHN|nr:hypothetical protein [Novosphingobium ovatum]NBC35717.1 hypothetical protein [Novosphingobium ovatum]